MTRVAFIAHLSEFSGAGAALLEVTRGIDPAGFEALLVLPGRGPLAERAEAARVRYEIVPNIEEGMAGSPVIRKLVLAAGRAAYIARMAVFLHRRKIDVVYINSSASIFAGIAAALLARPIVWHIHESIENPGRVQRWKMAFIELVSSGIVYASQSARAGFPARRVRRRAVTQNYVDAKAFGQAQAGPETRRSLGIVDGEAVVMLNGVFRRKGADVFLRAAEIVAGRHANPLHFLMVGAPAPGEQDYYAGLVRMANDSPVSGRVTFAGYRTDFAQVLACTNVFVSASRNEAQPIALLEAMAAGVPVVSTDVGDCRSILGDGRLGVVVGPDNPQELAEGILSVLENPAGARNRCLLAQATVAREHGGRDVWRPVEDMLAEIAEEAALRSCGTAP